jgi:hypothetical protein
MEQLPPMARLTARSAATRRHEGASASALPCCRQHLIGFKNMANPLAHLQTLEARCRQHNARVLTFIKFAQTRVQVATQGLDLQIGPQGPQQHGAAQARCAHHSTLRQVFQTGVLRRNPSIPRVFALHHAGQLKALGHVHGHVLERVHRDVRVALLQRHFQLLDEQALATHLGQAAVQDLVALGRHAEQFDRAAKPLQQGFDMFCLPQSQSALTGGNDDSGLCGLGHGKFPEKFLTS